MTVGFVIAAVVVMARRSGGRALPLSSGVLSLADVMLEVKGALCEAYEPCVLPCDGVVGSLMLYCMLLRSRRDGGSECYETRIE